MRTWSCPIWAELISFWKWSHGASRASPGSHELALAASQILARKLWSAVLLLVLLAGMACSKCDCVEKFTRLTGISILYCWYSAQSGWPRLALLSCHRIGREFDVLYRHPGSRKTVSTNNHRSWKTHTHIVTSFWNTDIE